MLRVLGEKKRKAAYRPYGKVARRLMILCPLVSLCGILLSGIRSGSVIGLFGVIGLRIRSR